MDRKKSNPYAPIRPLGGLRAAAPEKPAAAYRQFSASELYCPKCRRAMPVREKLLLILPSGELYDYVCRGCGSSLGSKTT